MRGILYKNVKDDGRRRKEENGKSENWTRFKLVLENAKNAIIAGAVSTALLFSPSAARAQEKAGENTQESVKQSRGFLEDLSYGFHYYNNDGGSALFGELDMTDWLGLTAGGIWLDQTPYGIASINLTPKIGFWDDTLVLNYFGNLTGTHMASYLYTSHGVGASAHFAIGDFRINLATLGQFGISYPTYDLLFAKWINGISLSYDINDEHRLGAYAINTNMWAASKTPKTAFAMDYAPRYQGTEVGIKYNYRTHFFTVYSNIDQIEPHSGIEYGREKLVENDFISVNAVVGAGIRGYNTQFFPLGFYVYGGIEVNFEPTEARERQNTFSVKFENKNIKGTASYDKQWVYEYGDITQAQSEWISKAQATLAQSDTFAGFAGAYEGASATELLTVAGYLASLLGRGGYDYGAYNDMMEFNIFSPRLEALSERNYDDILRFIRDYAAYYNEHGTYEGMPEELKRGVAVCAGIHEFVAEFLRANGMTAYAIGVVTKNAPHVVAAAFYDDKASIIDYGMTYTIKSSSLDDVLRVYSIESGVPVLQSQIFGKGGKYLGTYTTPQGKLVERTMKTDGKRLISTMLGQGPEKKKYRITAEEVIIDDFIEDTANIEDTAKEAQPTTEEAQPQKDAEKMEQEGKQEDKKGEGLPPLVPITPQGSKENAEKPAETKDGKRVAAATDLSEIKTTRPKVKRQTFPETMDRIGKYIVEVINKSHGLQLSKIKLELTVNRREGKIDRVTITEPKNLEEDVKNKIVKFIRGIGTFEKEELPAWEMDPITKEYTLIIGQPH